MPVRLPDKAGYTKDKNSYVKTILSARRDYVTEVGDTKSPDDYFPQVKHSLWNNEVNISRRIANAKGTISPTIEDDKITWTDGNIKSQHFESKTGVYRHVLELASKPLTNTIDISLQHKGLLFFQQPLVPTSEMVKQLGMTAQEIDAGRAENVRGCYVVQHATKGGIQRSGETYDTGQATIWYRPQARDASLASVFTTMELSVDTFTMQFTIPQSFLDNAAYPVSIY